MTSIDISLASIFIQTLFIIILTFTRKFNNYLFICYLIIILVQQFSKKRKKKTDLFIFVSIAWLTKFSFTEIIDTRQSHTIILPAGGYWLQIIGREQSKVKKLLLYFEVFIRILAVCSRSFYC